MAGQHRSTQRHGGKVIDLEETKLRHRLREIAAEHIRWGRRMAYRLLRREGWTVNHKRVQRLWREEGLQRPTPRKRKRARPADGSVRRHRAQHPHQVWAMDFQFDATADGRRLKFLNVIDEHSRLCLAIRVGRRCKAKERNKVRSNARARVEHVFGAITTCMRGKLTRRIGLASACRAAGPSRAWTWCLAGLRDRFTQGRSEKSEGALTRVTQSGAARWPSLHPGQHHKRL